MPPQDDPTTLAASTAVDLPAATRAVEDLLRALGAPLGQDPELADTPARVARALAEELLDGYRADPAAVLRDGVAAAEPGLVLLTDVRYASMCPHHLMPALGRAHVGYFPGGRVVGLGTLVRLLEVYAHRLVLQESLGQRVAAALCEHLGARGAGVVLRARHTCLSARGERQAGATVVTTAFAGSLATPGPDRELFLAALPQRRSDRRGAGERPAR